MSQTPETNRHADAAGSHAVPTTDTDQGGAVVQDTHDENLSWKDTVIGSDRSENVRNVSWGAIFAGITTFLAIVLLFALATASFGLGGSSTGATIMTLLGLVLGLFLGGAVAGSLAVRAGLIHGFLTWAGSVVAVVVLATMITLGAASTVGGVLGTVTDGLGQAVQVQPGDDVPTPSQQQLDEAQQTLQEYQDQARQTAQDAADAAKTGATAGFWGLLIGSLIAALGGLLGSRAVANKDPHDTTRTARRTV